MGQDSTVGELGSNVLAEVWRLVEAHRPAFGQARVYERAKALIGAELMSLARHSVTQGLLSLGLTDADWSSWYRLFSHKRYDEDELDRCLLRQTLEHVAPSKPYVIGVDSTQVPRCSLKMPGTGWAVCPRTPSFRRGIHRAQRFEHGAWLAGAQDGYSRAVPLRFLPLLSAKAVPVQDVEASKEWQAGLGVVAWVRQELDALGREGQPLAVVADGVYDTLEWWRGLPQRTVALVRTKANRKLLALPGPYSGCGRRRKYGEAVLAPKQWLSTRGGWRKEQVAVRGRMIAHRYRIEGPYLREGAPSRPLYLLVVGGASWRRAGREHWRRPAYYLVNAAEKEDGTYCLPYLAPQLLSWLWQRWELEVAHREMKAGLGLGEKQCWNPRSAVVSVRWSAWVYGLVVLGGYRAWGLFGGPACPGRWWPGGRRWSLLTLWRELRAKLCGARPFTPLWPGMTSNWGKTLALSAGTANALAGAARI